MNGEKKKQVLKYLLRNKQTKMGSNLAGNVASVSVAGN